MSLICRMIREMRAADVKPIAIWDQRGVREWKAAEAKKRLAMRALAFARRNHETERQNRLTTLHSLLTEYQSFPSDVQGAIRAFWKETSWMRYGPTLIPHYPPMEGIEGVLDDDTRASDFLERFDQVLASFESNYRALRPGRKTQDESEEIDEALKHVRDLEVWTGESAEAGSIERQRSRTERLGRGRMGGRGEEEGESEAKKEDLSVIDQKLQEMLPDDAWGETPTQTIMTQEEGAIIDSLLGVLPERILVEVEEGAGDYIGRRGEVLEEEVLSPKMLEGVLGTSKERNVQMQSVNDEPHVASSDIPRPGTPTIKDAPQTSIEEGISSLNTLMDRAPGVHEIYARQLALPTKQDHEDCRELLVKLGVPVLTAMIPYEAEGLASSLAKAGKVDFVGTEDSDVLGYEVSPNQAAFRCDH